MRSSSFSDTCRCFLFISLLHISKIMPYSLKALLASLIAKIRLAINSKSIKTIRKNLQLCYPEMSNEEVEKITYQTLKSYVMLTLEMGEAWFGCKQTNVDLIKEVEGKEYLDKIYSKKTPLIIAVPHIGNWELFWNFLQINYDSSAMYSPAKNAHFDDIMHKARKRFGGNLFATDPKGILGLLKAVKKGSILMILPDQAPRKGAGIFSKFFGKSAYTMTLLHKLLRKTDAKLLFAACIRDQNKGFKISIEDSENMESIDNVDDFNDKMNQKMETIINKNREQYQWGYKRFKRQQDGKNFYKQPEIQVPVTRNST
ncbi:MAG: lysophospholipid acyltransferase family protein [Gammaproteobacteria bacterium]|nr:lysophospholipid acyltransferase family protein [Gammaproteobacteria bacterium]MDH5630112.1 lysophospholipid acyltransferase family protein [Gammaproteobacteria bacterium]